MNFILFFRINQNPIPKTASLRALYLYLAFICLLPTIAFGRDYHVSASATGKRDGTSQANLCTLSYANNNLRAGETAYLYDDNGVIPERIKPTNNGAAENLITYMAADGESPVISTQDSPDADGKLSSIAIIGSINNEKQYISIKGVTTRSQNTKKGQRFFNVMLANHIYFENCLFETPAFIGGIEPSDFTYNMSYILDSSYIQFVNCEWDASTTPINSNSQHDLLNLHGVSHSLWKECIFGNVSHTSFRHTDGIGTHLQSREQFNAVIDCTFTNKWRRAYEFYADEWKAKPDRWLVHGNRTINMGWDSQNCPWVRDRGRFSDQKMDQKNFIVRENISYGSDTGYVPHSQRNTEIHKNNYVYHNTWYNNKAPAGNQRGGLGIFSDLQKVGYQDNVIINNIFWAYDGDMTRDNQTSTNEYQVWITVYKEGSDPIGNNFSYNSFGRKNGGTIETYIKWHTTTGSLSRVEELETQWHDNILADPGFVDPKNLNFTPTNLDVVDAATHLTLTKGSKSNSNTLVVDNASYFFSGPGSPWFLEETVPDTIYIEGVGAIQISSINYSTNTIVLSKNMTWGDNKKVYHRPFSGRGPDIGAVEKMGPSTTEVSIKSYQE